MKTFQHGVPLTDRELEILSLIAHGKSAKEAAIICGITPRTVESHLDATRMKLGARNRAHMVAIAIDSKMFSFILNNLEMIEC